jgi:nucleotide-binding universal stress UspA family protein
VTPIAAQPAALVVGFDGSEDDRQLVAIAVDFAHAFGARIEIVRAMDMASGDQPDDGPSRVIHAAMAQRVAERAREAEEQLAHLGQAMTARVNGEIEVRWRIVEGRPYEALRATAEAAGCWIVVGARRARTLLAHTVDQTLRHATRPALVVPDGCTWRAKGTVLTGIDAGELDAAVLKISDAIAARLQRRMGIVHVRTNGDESAMLRVTEHVRKVAPSVSATATLSVMRVEGSIAATLADHARRVGACLLVVGTHGRSGVERWVLGSTAESLAHRSTTPFLVVR